MKVDMCMQVCMIDLYKALDGSLLIADAELKWLKGVMWFGEYWIRGCPCQGPEVEAIF